MVGYAKIGNMGCNLYRVMTWHLRGVEGYGRRVERGIEGEFREGGQGRLCGLAKGDIMMRGEGGVVLLYPSHSRPLALLPSNCLFRKNKFQGGNNQRSNLDSRGDGSLV
jgi:hypothetical protein